MDVRKLRYFAVLAEEKHYGRAARRLAVSQPPLSLAIRQLEAELGARLFERDSRHVALTQSGLALQREASVILRRMEEAQALVRSVAEGRSGQVRIGFGGSMLYRGLADIVADFQAIVPSVELKLREMNSTDQIEALRRDEIDLGFVHGRATPAGLQGFRYHAEPFVACIPAANPDANAGIMPLHRLRNDNFVLFARTASPDYYELIIAACLAAGFTPRVRHEVRHWMSVVAFVANGMGVALVPRSLSNSRQAGASFVTLRETDVLSETWCIWNELEPRGAALAHLVTVARARSATLAAGAGQSSAATGT